MKENFYPRIGRFVVLISSVLLILWYARNVWTKALAKHQKTAEIVGDAGTKPDPISDSTRSSIYQTIANREYNITEDKKQGVLQSPNRKQNLRAYYEPGKLTIRNRVDSAGHNFRLTLKNAGVFADGKKLFAPQPTAAKETSDSKLLLRHEGFTEEFINTEAGIRQNFIIHKAPANTNQLQVRLDVDGLKVRDDDNNHLTFYKESGTSITYDSLKCWDAKGKILDAQLAYRDGQIRIDVNATDAAYPVTIDPIIKNGTISDANSVLQGFQSDAEFSRSAASAGDVNGDGYSDVIIGAPYYDDNQVDQGAFFLFMGSSTGLNPNGFPYTGAAQENSMFGFAVSSAGDMNKDGYSDIVVGSYNYRSDQNKVGAVYLYYGSSSGLKSDYTLISSTDDASTFGYAVAGAGDINADGYSDIIVGAETYNYGPKNNNGAAFIYLGSATGVQLPASDTLATNTNTFFNALFGASVAGIGDVNGDGFSDVAIGATQYMLGDVSSFMGALFIYHGSAAGLPDEPSLFIPGNKSFGDHFGDRLATAGDINGDGYSEMLCGSDGNMFLYYASPNGSGIDVQTQVSLAQYGPNAACAGDVNGDGFSDIISGRPFFENAQDEEVGRVVVIHGSKNGLSSAASSTIMGNQPNSVFGSDVASAGDVNGDGFSDILIGDYRYDVLPGHINDGLAFVYHGSAASVSAFPAAQIQAGQLDSDLGYSVSDAGDVNGDGYADVIVGAPFYDNGQVNEGVAFLGYGGANGIINNLVLIEMNQANAHFGYSVSGAGDTNGDGFDDVIIGANLYDRIGASDGGTGFVYYGSATGIQLGSNNQVYITQSGVQSGTSVSNAGDINGDGYDDIIVGAPFYQGGQFHEGAGIISFGSAAGISNGTGTIIEINQLQANFGNAVSNAGDVNGDGYDDIIIGAYQYDGDVNFPNNEGGVFIFHGSKAGINLLPNATLRLFKPDARFGYSVSNAGDINGDGFDDVIAGSINYEYTESQFSELNEGAAAVFFGSNTGVHTANPLIIESNQPQANLGSAVGGGDFNGDGYSDIAIGALNYTGNQGQEGAVFIYPGSASGVDVTTPPIILEGNQLACQLGISVSSAGDVDGDGYEDLIAGAASFNPGGRAVIYHSNSEPGPAQQRVKNLNRAYEDDLSTSLKQTNINKKTVGVGLFAKSFLGRSKAKLVWETRSQGQQFSHNSPITNSVQFSGEGDFQDVQNPTELKHLVEKPGIKTKLRVRVKYDPVQATTGQVYGPWKYVNESIVTTDAALPVTLITFQADALENQVQLSWATASEVNSDHFEIQRSADGKTWEKIGEIPALQNSNSNHNYSFPDNIPLKGTSYYRLKMIDLDQTFAFSKVQSVKIKSLTTVYPNPVASQLQVDSKEPILKIDVHNTSGVKVMSVENKDGIRGINMGSLPQGLYLIKSGGETFKVMKK